MEVQCSSGSIAAGEDKTGDIFNLCDENVQFLPLMRVQEGFHPSAVF